MFPLVLCLAALQVVDDPGAIMARMAANVEQAASARRQYVYQQSVRASLVRSNGDVARREKREYTALPTDTRTDKQLVKFQGEYRRGKQMVPYSEPGYKYKGTDIDGALLSELVDDLVNNKESRDGIPHSLFPLASKDLPAYRFALKGQSVLQGRAVWEIAFEPGQKQGCITVDECDSHPWSGTVWVDAEELQPVRIQTRLAARVPWGVRVFLGTNLRQTGFSISYTRAGEHVWFPSTYGTEFHLNVLWGYKRTVTLSMENSGFRRTGAESTIEYRMDEKTP